MGVFVRTKSHSHACWPQIWTFQVIALQKGFFQNLIFVRIRGSSLYKDYQYYCCKLWKFKYIIGEFRRSAVWIYHLGFLLKLMAFSHDNDNFVEVSTTFVLTTNFYYSWSSRSRASIRVYNKTPSRPRSKLKTSRNSRQNKQHHQWRRLRSKTCPTQKCYRNADMVWVRTVRTLDLKCLALLVHYTECLLCSGLLVPCLLCVKL